MEVFFQLVIIAFLLLIAIELLLIYRELVHNQVRRSETSVEKEEKSPSGQTINVNVASPAGLGPQGVPVAPMGIPGVVMNSHSSQGTGISGNTPPQINTGTDAQQTDDYGSASSSSSRTASRPSPVAPAKVANPFAKVCSACGAENSVYRTECFNCGKSI
jgi:ribosomal protein L40E